ncbi:Ig-like domain-containing protein [Aeromonas veronii]
MRANESNQFNFSHSIMLLLACLLLGCGADAENGSQSQSGDGAIPPTPVGQVMVVDGFSAVAPNQSARVDLSNYVRGQGAVLTEMYSPQSECRTTRLAGLTADLYVASGGLCEYTFTASNGKNASSATLNVLASSATNPLLPPLSHPMQLGDGNASFDLQDMMGSDWPNGYQLDTSSITVIGGGEGDATGGPGNTIIYTPPASADWNQIGFVLSNPEKPTEDMLGTIYVTVSETVNAPPSIAKPKYDYNVETGASITTIGSSTGPSLVINLETLPTLGIKDPEGGEWQLVHVMSYTSSVSPSDPSSVTNKRFNFTAAVPGDHIVSYIVADHANGFASGMIKINVAPKESPKGWNNIVSDEKAIFYATPLYSESTALGVTPAEAVWDEAAGNTIAGFTSLQAKAYCGSLRLPSKKAFGLVKTDDLKAHPRERGYLITDNGKDFEIYNIDTAIATPYSLSTSAPQYVMCVKFDDVSLKSLLVTPEAAVIKVHSTQKFTATGILSDGTSVDMTQDAALRWDSSNASIATISQTGSNKGLATGVNVGRATITASGTAYGTLFSSSAQLDVTEPEVVSLTVRPDKSLIPVGNKEQFTVIATLSDLSTVDMTNDAALGWASSDPSIATITSAQPAGGNGLATGVKPGTVNISATVTANSTLFRAYAELQVRARTTLDNFSYPDTTTRDWGEAKRYCESMRPAARLPTENELITLYLDSTSASRVGDENTEMCSKHNWPLINLCGGSTSLYWTNQENMAVYLHSGRFTFIGARLHVTCIRD